METQPMTPNELQNFLTLSYGELEELNMAAKSQRQGRVPMHQIQEERLKYLTDEKRIKAVTVLFSDLEGRLHMLDYDKKFLVKSWDNLTFDGSSIRGFTAQRERSPPAHGLERLLLGAERCSARAR
jgi:glutamine synthetase